MPTFETDVPELAVFCHRTGPVLKEQFACIAEYTKRPFTLLYHHGPGTAHANMNKVIDRSRSRYLVIMDDDVVPMVNGWLDHLLEVLRRNPDVGLVTPTEVKSLSQKHLCTKFKPYEAYESSWNPGYVMCLDRERVPNIRADENIPGPSGMSDLDISLQVRAAGFVPAMTRSLVVYHPDKPMSSHWRKQYQIVPSEELQSLHEQQMAYMRAKWSDGLFENNRFLKELRPLN